MEIDNDIRKKINSINVLIDNKKYNLAKREVIRFLKEFPNDINLNLHYINILLMEEEYDLALEVCKSNLSNSKIKFIYALITRRLNNMEESLHLFKELLKENYDKNILINIICILIKQKKFDEAYSYFKSIGLSDNLNSKWLYKISILRRYIYTNLYPELREILKHDKSLGYYDLQILDYSEESVKEYMINYKNPKYAFSNRIDFTELFDRVNKLIKNSECNTYDLYDKYVIHIPNIGFVNGIKTDYLIVSTIINTKDIIFMHPCIYLGKNAIEYSQEPNNQYEDARTKRHELSRIEKFNRKYGF